MSAKTARVRVRRTIVTSHTGEQALLIDVSIDCEVCGITEGTIMGHHLKTLYDALGRILADHPDLCGAGVAEVTETLDFTGVVVPGKVALN